MPLLSGLGSLHFRITTTSQEAQRYFDQGLLLFYGFNFEDSRRSFERASQIDPAAAMPHWGVALAVGPNYNSPLPSAVREKAGYDAVQTAWTLASNGPEMERAYIDALSRRFSDEASPDFNILAHDYSAAMCELSRRYADDPDAATLCAESLMDFHPWNLWTEGGKPQEGTREWARISRTRHKCEDL